MREGSSGARIRRLRRAAGTRPPPDGQLDLFSSGRVTRLSHGLAPFDEALLLDQRGHVGARAAYLRAVDVGDRPADACCNLGVLASLEEEYEEAIRFLTEALERDPVHAEAHFNLAHVYVELGWVQPAYVHYRLALAADPDFEPALFNHALVCIRLGLATEAVASLRAYRDLGTKDGKAELLLSQLEQVTEQSDAGK
jgi:tetratricopeptide (TPR) repeat protein